MLASWRMLSAAPRFMRWVVRTPASACQRLGAAVVAPRAAVCFATGSNPDFDPYSNKQMSDAIHRIAQVPVIEVDGNSAVCNGGSRALGACA